LIFGLSMNCITYPLDVEYCTKEAPRLLGRILRSYDSIVLSEQDKKKILDLGTSSIIYAGLHRSYLDVFSTCPRFLLEGLPFPRPIAGNNLMTPWMRPLMKRFSTFDLPKWGPIVIERNNRDPDYLETFCREIENLLREDQSILAFLEIEIEEHGQRKTFRTGRSYSGRVRRFASSLLTPAINVSKEGKKVYIVPISFSYDFVSEEKNFQKLTRADHFKRSSHSLVSSLGRLYYMFVECRYFSKMYGLGRGNVYIDVGEPILVDPATPKKELAGRAQKEAARCSRVTMPALVCYAINQGAGTRDEIKESIEKLNEVLVRKKLNFQNSPDWKATTDLALDGLVERKIVSNGLEVMKKRPDIVTYYANTIAHHFEPDEVPLP